MDEGTLVSQKRQAVLVLGMHRSGTSALARVLSLLGCALPKTLLGANPTQETGHWESEAVRDFNDEILNVTGSDWSDWLPLYMGWRETPAYTSYVERGCQLLATEFGEQPLMVLKDPRICRMAPFWLDVLAAAKVTPTIVMPIRSPLEVARSLNKRDGLDISLGLLSWLRHVLEAEFATRGQKRVTTSYDELLENWLNVANQIADLAGVRWLRNPAKVALDVERFLKKDLKHNVDKPNDWGQNPLISKWVREVYAILSDWSRNGERKGDYKTLDAVRAAFDEAAPAFARPLMLAKEDRQKADQLADQLARDRAYLEGRIAELQYDLSRAGERHEQALAVARADVEASQGELNRLQEWLVQSSPSQHDAALEAELTEVRASNARLSDALSQAEVRSEALLSEYEAKLLEQKAVLTDSQKRFEDAMQQLSEAMGENVRLTDTISQIEGQSLNAMAAIERSLEDERAKAEVSDARLAQAIQDLTAMAQRVGELESALLQRQEENAQAWAELSEAKIALDAMSAQLAEAEAKAAKEAESLRESELWVFRLAGERQASAAQLRVTEAKLVKLQKDHQSALAQIGRMQADLEAAKSELREQKAAEAVPAPVPQKEATVPPEVIAEMADMRRKLRELQDVRDEDHARFEAASDEVATLTRLLVEAQHQNASQEAQASDRLEAIERDLVQARDYAEEMSRQVTQALEQSSEWQRRVQQAEARVRDTEALKVDLEQKLAERFGEIAAMTSSLMGKEADARSGASQADLLRGICAVLTHRPKWWAVMPESWRHKRELRMLKRRGIFDADAYCERYPDVVQAGLDPLRHYILHGLAEGRNGAA